MADDGVIESTDEELAEHLRRLFEDEGHPEVEVIHPTEGRLVYTREAWLRHRKVLETVADMSPAQRLQETNKLKNKQRIRFRTAMLTADVRTIDTQDEGNFGKDIEGKDIPLEGMVFAHTRDYPPGLDKLPGEIGCFVDEAMRRPPIRILDLHAIN